MLDVLLRDMPDVVAVLRRASKRPSPAWRARVHAVLRDNAGATGLVRAVVEAAATGDAGEWDALATENGDITRGAVHACALAVDEPVTVLLAVARRAGRARIGSGVAPNPKVAGAAIMALTAAGTEEAGVALVALRNEIRHRGLLADVETGLAALAKGRGVSAHDLVDTSLMSDPAALAAHLDSGMGDERTWSLDTWRARFIDHPTAGSVGRDLVWCFDGLAGRWSDDLGAVVDANGRRVAIEAASAVGLWHPAAGADHELDSWREALARAEVEQPFNQVGREVFVVEPHDQPTALYTARFGGVSVRYRQVLTVGKQRRWFASAAGYWSPEAPGCSFRDYRDGEWRVTMLFDVVGTGYAHATAETCISDQVQFARYDVTENGWRVRPLAEVPPIIFSEALRDVALLVEVGRIERVDAWFDRGHVRTPHWPSTAWVRGAFYELPASDGSWQRLHAPRTAPPRITS